MSETLREKIAKYISREIALRDTPAYALSGKEMSYGITSLISQELDKVKPKQPDGLMVGDAVARFRKWEARGTPLPAIMNKVLVNVNQASHQNVIDQMKELLK